MSEIQELIDNFERIEIKENDKKEDTKEQKIEQQSNQDESKDTIVKETNDDQKQQQEQDQQNQNNKDDLNNDQFIEKQLEEALTNKLIIQEQNKGEKYQVQDQVNIDDQLQKQEHTIIKGTMRSDGTMRKDIKVRAGYKNADMVQRYVIPQKRK
ncbi:unnamed protein product [Paramecium octaurelia]|uniref:WIBG Mago-binding domain-containing protein n=1 Tax=Paramecium octaurelia TaxID=43137 RepID=A0A8S1VBX4_PAROT|nr:unnamed protein product [Paramecium octaurelia]